MTTRIIAIIWDFDKTLTSGYMQVPLFEHYGVDATRFWDEVNALHEFHAKAIEGEAFVSDFLYLNHILTYVRAGVFAGLNNDLLRRLGGELRLAPGVPEVFELLNRAAEQHEPAHADAIRVEHYVITTGLRQIVLGSPIGPYMRHVWGCEFLVGEAPPGFLEGDIVKAGDGTVSDIGYVIDSTTKTRAIFEINKGVRENLGINVNTAIRKEHRRVPFENMIYIADGPSDIPSLSVVKQFGGKTLGVYQPDSSADLEQAEQLFSQGRVDKIGPADFRQGSQTFMWLKDAVVEIADRLTRSPAPAEATHIAPTPRHLYT